MIFPSGKARNDGFNPLSQTRESFQTHSERQSAENGASRAQIAQEQNARKVAKLQQNDVIKHTVAPQPQTVQGGTLMERLKAVLATRQSSAMSHAGTIGKAQCGGLSDMGGPSKQMRMATSPTIANPAALEEILAGKVKLERGEEIKAANAKVAEQRAELRKQQFVIDPEALKAAMGRADSVQGQRSLADKDSNYASKVSSSQMSIFDSSDKFEALPELTEGEKIKLAAAERKNKKDDSWMKANKGVTTKSKLSSFFDALKKSQEGA